MCDCYAPNGEPIPTNKRHGAAKIFSQPDVKAEEPWSVSSAFPYLQSGTNWTHLLCTDISVNQLVFLMVHVSKFRFGIEQEYTLLQKDTNWPLGWPLGGYPGPQVELGICYSKKLLFSMIIREEN